MNKDQKAETVGSLIEKLATFPFHTKIFTSCRSCQKGAAGSVINVRDCTDQTFGYIELETNTSWIKTPTTEEGLLRKYEETLENLNDRVRSLYLNTPIAVHDLIEVQRFIAVTKEELKKDKEKQKED